MSHVTHAHTHISGSPRAHTFSSKATSYSKVAIFLLLEQTAHLKPIGENCVDPEAPSLPQVF